VTCFGFISLSHLQAVTQKFSYTQLTIYVIFIIESTFYILYPDKS